MISKRCAFCSVLPPALGSKTWRTTQGMGCCITKVLLFSIYGPSCIDMAGAAEGDPVLTFGLHTASHKLVLDIAEVLALAFYVCVSLARARAPQERNRSRAGADKVAGFRLRYEEEVRTARLTNIVFRLQQHAKPYLVSALIVQVKAAKNKYASIDPEFSDDDMNATIAEEDRLLPWIV